MASAFGQAMLPYTCTNDYHGIQIGKYIYVKGVAISSFCCIQCGTKSPSIKPTNFRTPGMRSGHCAVTHHRAASEFLLNASHYASAKFR